MMNQKVLAIIPARGGSKGIPRKNIRLLSGRPLIDYSIEATKRSRVLTDTYVSTEDEEIAEVSRTCGARVIQRPRELADDHTPMLPVIQDALSRLAKNGDRYDVVFILQPTCPLRTGEDIDAALSHLNRAAADSVVGVYRVEDQHPGRMYFMKAGLLTPYAPELVSRNRQELPPVYHRNGSIYGVRTEIALQGSLFGPLICPYVMSRERSLNIDDEFDWTFAEWLMTR